MKKILRNFFGKKEIHPVIWTEKDQSRYEKTLREFKELVEESKRLTGEK